MAKTRMRDLVVLLPGITGSVLSRVDPVSKKLVEVWAPSGQALWQAIASLGGSLEDLRVPGHDPRKAPPDTGYRATRVVSNLHGVLGLGKIDGYTALGDLVTSQFLVTRSSGAAGAAANFVEFAYDWRLSNRHSASQLRDIVAYALPAWRKASGAADAKLILIAHSMGGLVSRYYLEVLEGWKECRALVTFGTPFRGAVNAIDFIANGYKGRLLDLTEVLRSCPAVYELMPIYEAVHDGTWRRVSEGPLPNAVPDYVAAAAEFHDEIKRAVSAHESEVAYLKDRYKVLPFVGVSQPTVQSAFVSKGKLLASYERPKCVDEPLEGGDGTVPRVSATPIELSDAARETFFGERHPALQNNEYALDDLRERLKQLQAHGLKEVQGTWRAGQRPTIGLELEDLYLPNEPVVLRAIVRGGTPPKGLVARVAPGTGAGAKELPFIEDANGYVLHIDGLSPGLYRVQVRSASGGETAPTPVRDVFEVAGA